MPGTNTSTVPSSRRPSGGAPLRTSQRCSRHAPGLSQIAVDTPSYEVVGADQPVRVVESPRKADATATDKPVSKPSLDSRIKLDRLGKPIMVNGKPWTGEVFDNKPIRLTAAD